jgi:ribokinase
MKIAVVGSYGVGMTMRAPRVPGPGETVLGGIYASGPGGKGSNQAIGMARLGAEVHLLTALGADVMAAEARDLWQRERVNAQHVITGTESTMVGFILVEESGENRIIIAPGALDELEPRHVEAFRATIRDADMLVASMEIPLDTVIAALRIAKQEGTPALLNPAPATFLPDEVWELIDYITPNESEAPVLLGLGLDHGLGYSELMARMRSHTLATIVLTLGAEGAAVDSGSGVTMVRAIAADRVLDTTGAGDSFTAALAVALVGGESLESAVLRGSAAGSHAVTIEGVIDALPTPQDILDLIGRYP